MPLNDFEWSLYIVLNGIEWGLLLNLHFLFWIRFQSHEAVFVLDLQSQHYHHLHIPQLGKLVVDKHDLIHF